MYRSYRPIADNYLINDHQIRKCAYERRTDTSELEITEIDPGFGTCSKTHFKNLMK